MLKNIQIKNFRSLRDITVNFPAEVILLEGQNGSGKSSLLEAVIFALYGVNPVKREDLLYSDADDGTLSISLEFEAGGIPYRVERTSKPAKNESQAYLWRGEERIARGWRAVTEAVADIFMPYEFFKLTCYSPQNELAAFAAMAPEERRKTLSRYLGVEQVNDAVKQLRQDIRQEEAALEALSAYVVVSEEELEHEVSTRRKAREIAKKRLVEAQKALMSVENKLKKLQEEIRRADQITVRYEEALKRYDELDAQGRELSKSIRKQREVLAGQDKDRLTQEIDELEKELPALSQRTSLLSNLEMVEIEIRELSSTNVERDWDTEIKEAEKQLKHFSQEERVLRVELEEGLLHLGGIQLRKKLGDTDKCPVCASPLSDAARNSLIQQASSDEAELSTEIKRLQTALQNASEAKNAAERKLTEIAADKRESAIVAENLEKAIKKRNQLHTALADLPAGDFEKTQTKLAVLRKDLAAFTTVEANENELKRLREAALTAGDALEKAEKALDALPHSLEELEQEQVRLNNKKTSKKTAEAAAQEALSQAERELSQAEQDLASYRRVKADVERRRGVIQNLQTLEQELKGFRTYLLEKARPSVSRTAAQLLAEISEGRYQTLSLAEDFSITVVDTLGRELSYDTLSGGEKDLVSLCLRLAFPKVQAASFLLLDEVFGSQDAERQVNIIQALLRVREHFPQILLTTHTQEAKEYAEAVLQFSWDGGVTKVAWAA